MITSKQIITVTRDDPRFDTIYESFKTHGFRIDEDTLSATFTKSDICDVVPVTRCRNCENFVVDEDQTYCMERYGQCDEDGFCAWAEKRG